MNKKEFKRKLYFQAGNTLLKPLQAVSAPELNVSSNLISLVNEPRIEELGVLVSAEYNKSNLTGAFKIPFKTPIGYELKHVSEREINRFLRMMAKAYVGNAVKRADLPELKNLSGEQIGYPQFIDYLNHIRFDVEIAIKNEEKIRRESPYLILNGQINFENVQPLKDKYQISFKYDIEHKIEGDLSLILNLKRRSLVIETDLFVKEISEEKKGMCVPYWMTSEFKEERLKNINKKWKSDYSSKKTYK